MQLPILDKLMEGSPFNTLAPHQREELISVSEIVKYEIGARVLSPTSPPPGLLLVLQGQVRLMTLLSSGQSLTLEKRGPGQMLGWISILRQQPTELVQAYESTVCLLIPRSFIEKMWLTSPDFLQYFRSVHSPSEMANILLSVYKNFVSPPADEESWLSQAMSKSRIIDSAEDISDKYTCFLSVSAIVNGNLICAGEMVVPYATIESCLDESFGGIRLLACPSVCVDPYQRKEEDFVDSIHAIHPAANDFLSQAIPAEQAYAKIASFQDLGFVSQEDLDIASKYPSFTGQALPEMTSAILKNTADYLKCPYPKDIIEKIIRQQLKRRQKISLDLVALLLESCGMSARIGKIRRDQLASLEWPAVVEICDNDNNQSRPVVIYGIQRRSFTVADPLSGLVDYSLDQISPSIDESIRVVSVSRSSRTKVNRFGWSWFTPLLSKYSKSLLIVLLASFATQLATLAIPLLMQQIIDKTLSQGNISSLNVLGAALVTVALFQSLMTALRTFVFKDTADRMDLQLGATVIDRLLRLPLPFFDKRPVGELSQRLGEMNTIRGFLTGTAITSVMDMLFSVIYLVVMVLYSPLLTVVALSTFPVYATMVFIVAPLYKSLIRKQAVASAKTQSHVIEVLSAIQTVKAQNVELASRWKWQDRYQNVVEEGFKAVTVGTVSGQIGAFLNTLSSLLILWVGMIQVIEGNLTLGQLIAFRIIAGYVTGPLLRLSNLYQGFQKVALSFERLGDIINEQPESEQQSGQISLPVVEGDVRYDSVSFRFASTGPLTIDNVSLSINPGSFVGIVGQSGSGKSTLMKLLGRLYEPNGGKIVVDGYDISKVDLSSLRQQIGIVPQDSLLFEGSVKDNLTLGRPEVDVETMIDACKVACAHDFVMELPDGYNTMLSEKGSNLSGGQRQRLSIARTIINEPRLLVMDEATSALDYQTEAQVCANLSQKLSRQTVFFITHRLGTIKNADLIVMMHRGRIVEQGTHAELMNMAGRYHALYRQQEAGASGS